MPHAIAAKAVAFREASLPAFRTYAAGIVTNARALAEACGRPIEIAPVVEATTLGAAYLAGMAVGTWADEDDVAAAWAPKAIVTPTTDDKERGNRRARWLDARARSEKTIPELSALDF